MMIPKARYGEPCNGCGRCCAMIVCPLGATVFGSAQGPCPALERDDEEVGTYSCGLIRDPHRHAPQLAETPKEALRDGAITLNGAGLGCDAAHDEFVPTATRSMLYAKAKAKAIPQWRIKAAMRAWKLTA